MRAVGSRATKKPRFSALLIKSRQSIQQSPVVEPQGVVNDPVVVQEVKILWVAVSDKHVAHKIDLMAGGDTAVCGQSVANAKLYHGDNFCKRCLKNEGVEDAKGNLSAEAETGSIAES